MRPSSILPIKLEVIREEPIDCRGCCLLLSLKYIPIILIPRPVTLECPAMVWRMSKFRNEMKSWSSLVSLIILSRPMWWRKSLETQENGTLKKARSQWCHLSLILWSKCHWVGCPRLTKKKWKSFMGLQVILSSNMLLFRISMNRMRRPHLLRDSYLLLEVAKQGSAMEAVS